MQAQDVVDLGADRAVAVFTDQSGQMFADAANGVVDTEFVGAEFVVVFGGEFMGGDADEGAVDYREHWFLLIR